MNNKFNAVCFDNSSHHFNSILHGTVRVVSQRLPVAKASLASGTADLRVATPLCVVTHTDNRYVVSVSPLLKSLYATLCSASKRKRTRTCSVPI
jgi:hypothetical protein